MNDNNNGHTKASTPASDGGGLCPENLFEPLPRKAKRRKKTTSHHHGNNDDKDSGQVVSLVPKMNPVTPIIGVGIQALDPQRLTGSQRVGIIGLPGTESDRFFRWSE